jgi:hypothetical protein
MFSATFQDMGGSSPNSKLEHIHFCLNVDSRQFSFLQPTWNMIENSSTAWPVASIPCQMKTESLGFFAQLSCVVGESWCPLIVQKLCPLGMSSCFSMNLLSSWVYYPPPSTNWGMHQGFCHKKWKDNHQTFDAEDLLFNNVPTYLERDDFARWEHRFFCLFLSG